MFGVTLVIAVGTISYLLTRLMMLHGQRFGLMDIPNGRSSHTRPTPRGGGVAIVIACLLALAVCAITAHLEGRLTLAIFCCGGFVAMVGFWDDYHSLPALPRLSAQIAAGIALVLFTGVPGVLNLGPITITDRLFLITLAVIALVWLTNLTNFMDGIDGLAGAECVFVMSAGGALLYRQGDRGLFYLCLAVSAAAMGFLLLNRPPARIFMGDVGSGFIGLMFGAILLADTARQPAHIWVWLILLSSFLADSTITLLRRLLSGTPVWVAHRTHAYQHAAARWGHLRVTLTFTAVNVLWLAPLALLASEYPEHGFALFAVALLPLAVTVWRLKAGTASETALKAG